MHQAVIANVCHLRSPQVESNISPVSSLTVGVFARSLKDAFKVASVNYKKRKGGMPQPSNNFFPNQLSLISFLSVLFFGSLLGSCCPGGGF
jgi:hypothetical protein